MQILSSSISKSVSQYHLVNLSDQLTNSYYLNLLRMLQLASESFNSFELPVGAVEDCRVELLDKPIELNPASSTIVDLNRELQAYKDSRQLYANAKIIKQKSITVDRWLTIKLKHPYGIYAEEIKLAIPANMHNSLLLQIGNRSLLLLGANIGRLNLKYSIADDYGMLAQLVIDSVDRYNRLTIDLFSHCSYAPQLLQPIKIDNVYISEPYLKFELADIALVKQVKEFLLKRQTEFSVVLVDEYTDRIVRTIPLAKFLEGSISNRFALNITDELAEFYAMYNFLPDIAEDILLSQYSLYLMYKPAKCNIYLQNSSQTIAYEFVPVEYTTTFKPKKLQIVELPVFNANNELTIAKLLLNAD